MKVKEIIEALNAGQLHAPEEWERLEVSSVVASDLISDILVCEGEQQLRVFWIVEVGHFQRS